MWGSCAFVLVMQTTIGLLLGPTCSAGAGNGGTRYLLYSVNPGEGFNLRRDVHLRAATLVRKLREKEDWVLVLPPWPQLHHWKSDIKQHNVPWEKFFDLPSLNEYVPSIEFNEYLKREGHVINEVMYLQEFAEGWGEHWTEKMEDRPCIGPTMYRQISATQWDGYVFGREDMRMDSFRCVSVQGLVSILVPELQERKPELRSVFVEHFEMLLHQRFAGVEFWAARRSMVYAKPLRATGNAFMKAHLGYDPGEGNGRMKPREGGGAFIAVHFRRRDYLYAHPDAVPSLDGAANQINRLKSKLDIERVFLATDSSNTDKKKLRKLVKGLVWFTPSDKALHRYGDGGIAIIDQWIASHAKYFIGTAQSTFSFRIREDRQFMGFSQESTYHNLCGPTEDENDPDSCDKPTYWRIVEQQAPGNFRPSSSEHQEL